MKLIGLKKYRHGYTGFLETADYYAYFQFARGKCTLLQHYAKQDFQGHAHFVDVIRKFVHVGFFFQNPVEIETVSEEELNRVATDIRTTSESAAP
jgi:glucan biosynthesis protein